MNSEQESARKNGRTVVEVVVTLYIKTLSDDEALMKADQWLQSLNNANYEEVQALRGSEVFLSSWDAAIPQDPVPGVGDYGSFLMSGTGD